MARIASFFSLRKRKRAIKERRVGRDDRVARCRSEFTDSVSCVLPGFVRERAVRAVVADVEAREDRAFLSSRHRSPYGFYDPRHGETPPGHRATMAHTRPQRRHVLARTIRRDALAFALGFASAAEIDAIDRQITTLIGSWLSAQGVAA